MNLRKLRIKMIKKGDIIRGSELEEKGLEVFVSKEGLGMLKSEKEKAFYDVVVFKSNDEVKYQVFGIYKSSILYNFFNRMYEKRNKNE